MNPLTTLTLYTPTTIDICIFTELIKHRTPCVCGAHPLCCMTQIARHKADVGQFEYLTLHARACPALTR